MTLYTYSRRPIGSCKARVAARGADCAQSLANAIALYQRPILVHSGPSPMRMEEDQSVPWPWPWVRMDTAVGVPTRLEDATFYPRHERGSIDISMRLIGMYQMIGDGGVNLEPQDDPATHPTVVPCELLAELCQYVSGTAPTVLASTTVRQEIIAYPNYKTPWYPLLTLLALGTNDYTSPGYDRNLMSLGAGGLLRTGQLYPPDLALLQRVRLTIDFEPAAWSPSYATALTRPVFVRVTCIRDAGRPILYDPLASTNDEHIRIFNVGSEIRMRGRL